MTEKQFTFDNESLLKDGEFWLDGSIATICNAEEITELLNELNDENEQLKQQVKDLEFELRTIKAYDRTVKEEHSDTAYDFKKKLEKW